jgi:hypothetical protein
MLQLRIPSGSSTLVAQEGDIISRKKMFSAAHITQKNLFPK